MRTPLTLPSASASAVTTRNSARLPDGQFTLSASRYRRSAVVSSCLAPTAIPPWLEMPASRVPSQDRAERGGSAQPAAARSSTADVFGPGITPGGNGAAGGDLHGERWIGHPANLLIHAEHVEAVPALDNLAVFDLDDCDAPEVDRLAARLAAKGGAGVAAGDMTLCSDHVAFGQRPHDLDRQIAEAVAKHPEQGLECRRPLNGSAGKTVRDRVGSHERIDALLAPLIPHFLEPTPNDRIR